MKKKNVITFRFDEETLKKLNFLKKKLRRPTLTNAIQECIDKIYDFETISEC